MQSAVTATPFPDATAKGQQASCRVRPQHGGYLLAMSVTADVTVQAERRGSGPPDSAAVDGCQAVILCQVRMQPTQRARPGRVQRSPGLRAIMTTVAGAAGQRPESVTDEGKHRSNSRDDGSDADDKRSDLP